MITGPMPVAQVTSGRAGARTLATRSPVESGHARLRHATSRPIRRFTSKNLQQPIQQNRFRHASQYLLQVIQRLYLPLEERPQPHNGGRPLPRVQRGPQQQMLRAPLQQEHRNAVAANLESDIPLPFNELEALSWPSLHELHGLAAQL